MRLVFAGLYSGVLLAFICNRQRGYLILTGIEDIYDRDYLSEVLDETTH